MMLTSIELFRKPKGTFHVGDPAHVPIPQVLVENGSIGKHVLHILYLACIPGVQGLIKVHGGEEHPRHGLGIADVLLG